MSILCSLVGASFTVAAVAQVLRSKKGIVAVGNAQIDTAQSQFGGASALFDGDADYLAIANMTSANTFTFESWIRFTSLPTSGSFQMLVGSSSVQYFALANVSGSYFWELSVWTSGLSQYVVRFPATVSTNTWYHIATQKTGTTISLYQNGTSISSSATFNTLTTAMTLFDTTTRIGAWSNDGYGVNGHMDEVRISDSVRYTTNFVAPTLPFVNDTNTVLLIHANGTDATTFFEDDNNATTTRTARTITAVGTAQLSTAQEKFGQSSLLLDDSPEAYLTVAHASDMLTGTGAFTVEGWFRPQLAGDGGQGVGTRFWFFKGVNSATGFGLGVTTDGVRFRGPGTTDLVYTGSISSSAWTHIAFVYDGTNKKIYVNGTQQATAAASLNITDTSNYQIGYFTGIFAYNGWIDEIRVSRVARYTAAFTAPTTTFENDANTLLLIHADGADASTTVTDDNSGRSPRALIAQGNAQIDTAQSKFGGSALLCDGTGDYVRSPAGTQWDFGTGSFTIEYFIRFNAINTLYVPIAMRGSGSIFNGEWWCEITAAENKMYWGFKNQAGTQYYVNLALAGTAFATGQWYHIALVNNAGTAQMYVNGTAIGATTALSGSFGNNGTDLWIGAGAGAYSLNGWMDEVRISNTARYTTGFTPSTTPFVNDANTLLLVHADGTDATTVFRDDNGTGRSSKGVSAIGNAKISTAQSKFGGASSLYDGTGDYLLLANSSDFNFGSGNWTAEFWWYQPSNVAAGVYSTLLCFGVANGDTGWLISTEPSTNPVLVISSSNGSNSLSIIANSAGTTAATWNHIAVVVNSSVATIYVNGTASGSTGAIQPKASTGLFYIGGGLGGLSSGTFGSTGDIIHLNGYLDEIRVSNIARYTANFTPSTTPFQNDANTVLLLHMDGTNASTVFPDDNGIAPYTP